MARLVLAGQADCCEGQFLLSSLPDEVHTEMLYVMMNSNLSFYAIETEVMCCHFLQEYVTSTNGAGQPPSSSSPQMSAGAMAGIIVGAVAGLAGIAVIAVIVINKRNHSLKQMVREGERL